MGSTWHINDPGSPELSVMDDRNNKEAQQKQNKEASAFLCGNCTKTGELRQHLLPSYHNW